MEVDIDVVMNRLEPYLERFDTILRFGHEKYGSIPAEIAIDYDASTQAHCTNRHVLAKAHEILDDLPNVRHMEVRGQNLWLFETADAVVRFKKTDEEGLSSNYPTPQARSFDEGDPLPGLSPRPTRLTAGYLLDPTGSGFRRSQISLPTGKGVTWCAAIIPSSGREASEVAWYEVTRQRRMRL